MKPILRICLMFLLFISFLVGSFGIISYLSELALFENPVYQLVIGIGGILIAIVCIVFLLKSPGESKSEIFENDIDKEIEREIEKEIAKDEINQFEFHQLKTKEKLESNLDVDETIEDCQSINDEEDEDYDIIEVKKSIVLKDKLKDVNYEVIDEENLEGFTTNFDIVNDDLSKIIPEATIDDVNLEAQNIQAEIDSASTDEESKEDDLQTSEESIQKQEDLQQDNESSTKEEIVEDNEKESLDEKVSDNELVVNMDGESLLTETQINYINRSDNSYLNTQGMPQLYMTDEMQSPRQYEYVGPEKRVTSAEKENKIDSFIKSSDPYEDLYVQEDNAERLISILVTVVICLIIGCLIMGGIYLYTRFLG